MRRGPAAGIVSSGCACRLAVYRGRSGTEAVAWSAPRPVTVPGARSHIHRIKRSPGVWRVPPVKLSAVFY
jgi:hypothetical protein